ncbi:MAG: hypothetical protein P9M03_06615, partial [Candidatus Theseobacter exili]|nr:hypothetical protein [Candidatus Theseobacter exili]
MRLVLHNPQKVNFVGKTVQDWLTRGKAPAKYEYLQKYIREKKAIVYCDEFGSSLGFGFLRRARLTIAVRIAEILEIYLWLCINNINPFKVKIIFDSSRIKRDDIFLSFTHFYLDNEGEVSKKLIALSCIKVFMLSHYMFHPSTISKNIERGGAHFLVAENNLSKNSLFFKKYFPGYLKDIYTLPFCYKNRFKKNSTFASRKNKCLATGSVQNLNIQEEAFREMCEFYKVDTFHPMRQAIYFNKHKITDYIDSFISNINEDTGPALEKVKKPSGNKLNRI